MTVNARRTRRSDVESSFRLRLGGLPMDAIFWLLTGLILYFLFFRPPG